ncbi:DUF3135 domain-containing protein [Marinobacter panjinensis]
MLRSELMEDCIRRSSVSNQRRLRGLQFVIEALLCQQRSSEPSAPANARALHFRRSHSSVD